MKTAMQELIDELDLTKIVERDKLLMVKYIIQQCLEKEKEHIIEAFEQGLEFGFPTNGSNYFNKTYNKNK